MKYYRLPRENSEIQWQYKIVLRTNESNWNDRHIYAAHWSTGERKIVHDLPDILIPKNQFKKIKQKYNIAKNVKNKCKNPVIFESIQ